LVRVGHAMALSRMVLNEVIVEHLGHLVVITRTERQHADQSGGEFSLGQVAPDGYVVGPIARRGSRCSARRQCQRHLGASIFCRESLAAVHYPARSLPGLVDPFLGGRGQGEQLEQPGKFQNSPYPRTWAHQNKLGVLLLGTETRLHQHSQSRRSKELDLAEIDHQPAGLLGESLSDRVVPVVRGEVVHLSGDVHQRGVRYRLLDELRSRLPRRVVCHAG
jgi:hypothetical protein